MKTAAVSLLITLVLSSQASAVLRSRFPIRPHAPYHGQVIIIEDDSLKNASKNPPPKAPR